MPVLSVEQIITISVMCIWFVFPIGMFISVMRQQNDEIRSHIPRNGPPVKDNVVHIKPISVHTYDHDEDEEDLKYEDYDYTRIPKKNPGGDGIHRHT